MRTDNHVYSDLAIPPGEYLEEVLSELGMTKQELASRMNRPAVKLNAIYKGDKAITGDTALQLEQVVGVPAHIWTGLEATYRLSLARNRENAEQEKLKDEAPLLTPFCYGELAKLGHVPKTRSVLEKIHALRRFFGVTTLHNIFKINLYSPALRSSKKKIPAREALASWFRIGERKAQRTDCAPFDKKRLQNALYDIRAMTTEPPGSFMGKLEETLRDCGVVLELCPHLPKTFVNGATFWIGNKAVLMMTIRGKWADIFWFSLFHEIGHLCLHGKTTFIDWDFLSPELAEQEAQADAFAQNALIPKEEYRRFTKEGKFDAGSIQLFAIKMGLSSGIVVGRLQHDGLLQPSWCNGLRTQYEWSQVEAYI
jgi:HTH-type transcriptional regulator / antitoxin HigA